MSLLGESTRPSVFRVTGGDRPVGSDMDEAQYWAIVGDNNKALGYKLLPTAFYDRYALMRGVTAPLLR